jgi:hypothetical protein
MFQRSKGGSTASSKGPRSTNIIRKKIFPPFWKRPNSKYFSSKGSVFSWDEASYECQNSENRTATIDRIPTVVEYSSSSSNDQSLENDVDENMGKLLRYSVPMEINQQVEAVEKHNFSSHCHENEDNFADKYSINDEDNQNYDDDDNDDENYSFMSDTALRDEVNIEREKIKLSFVKASEERSTTKQTFFNVSACFGHLSTTSRKYYPESPTKIAYSMRYELESNQKYRLD